MTDPCVFKETRVLSSPLTLNLASVGLLSSMNALLMLLLSLEGLIVLFSPLIPSHPSSFLHFFQYQVIYIYTYHSIPIWFHRDCLTQTIPMVSYQKENEKKKFSTSSIIYKTVVYCYLIQRFFIFFCYIASTSIVVDQKCSSTCLCLDYIMVSMIF